MKADARKATELYQLEYYAEAAELYASIAARIDDAAAQFNLGQAYRLAGKNAEAIAAYKAYLANYPEAPARGEAEAYLRELGGQP